MKLTEEQIENAHIAWLEAVGWGQPCEMGPLARKAIEAIADHVQMPTGTAEQTCYMYGEIK